LYKRYNPREPGWSLRGDGLLPRDNSFDCPPDDSSDDLEISDISDHSDIEGNVWPKEQHVNEDYRLYPGKGRSYHNPVLALRDARNTIQRLERALELNLKRGPWSLGRPALDIHRAGDGCYVNPAAPLLMRPILDDLLAPVLVSEDNPQKVTILTADWHTSVGPWFFDKRAMKAAVREIMGRRHGVFSIEFAVYRNQRDTRTPYRPIVAFHVEGVAWGTETERQKRVANKVLPPGLFSAPSVVRKDIYDRRGAVDYCIKHPYRVYSVYWFADGTRNHQATNPSYRLMYEIWKEFGTVWWPEMMFGINDGKEIVKRFEDRAACAHW